MGNYEINDDFQFVCVCGFGYGVKIFKCFEYWVDIFIVGDVIVEIVYG